MSQKIIQRYLKLLFFFNKNYINKKIYIQQEAIEDTDDEDIIERSDEEDPLGDPLATDNQGFNMNI